MKRLLRLFTRYPKTALLITIILQIFSILWALLTGSILLDSHPDCLTFFFWIGLSLTAFAWWKIPFENNPIKVWAFGILKLKALHVLAYLGLFLFVTGSFPIIQIKLERTDNLKIVESPVMEQFVLVDFQGKNDRNVFNRIRNVITKGSFHLVKRAKRVLNMDPRDPYRGKRTWLLLGVIFGGLAVTFALGILACVIACNGSEALAIILLLGGQALIIIFAIRIVKKYWMKWRLKEEPINETQTKQ